MKMAMFTRSFGRLRGLKSKVQGETWFFEAAPSIRATSSPELSSLSSPGTRTSSDSLPGLRFPSYAAAKAS